MLHGFIAAVCRTPGRISANSVRRRVSTRNLHSRSMLSVLQHRSLSRIYRCFARRRKGIPMPRRPSDGKRQPASPDGCPCIPFGSSCRLRPKPGFCYPGASEYPQARASSVRIHGTNRCSGCRDGCRRSAPALSRQTTGNPLGSLH